MSGRNGSRPLHPDISVEALKLIVGNLVAGHAQLSEHFETGFDHHGGTAKIVFCVTGAFMAAEILLEHDLMDKSQVTGPVILGQR